MKKRQLIGTGLLVVAVLTIAIIALPRLPVPQKITKQVAFILFIPGNNSEYKVQSSKITFDSTNKVVTIPVESPKDTSITLNEQATPQQFSDIPQYYLALIEKLNGYSSFDSANGHVYLTRPRELKGSQQAIMSAKGTLIFAHPTKDLTDDQWRKFFNSLIEVK